MAEQSQGSGSQSQSGELTGATDVYVKLGTSALEDWTTIVVDQDIDEPDMCQISVHNATHEHTNGCGLGDEVEVKIGGEGGTTIFKGEVVALEPEYKTRGETLVVIRAYNKLHRLLRGRKSRTFLNKKDSDIASEIAGEHGLTKEGDDTAVSHKHVYQHNQSDLEFLRVRAARNGFEIACEDATLYFRKPKHDEDSGIELELENPEAGFLLKRFAPRLSSARIVSKVEVHAWDPEKKEEIVGTAEVEPSSLGGTTGADAAQEPFGEVVTATVDHPVYSQQEADELAKAKLGELSMDYITGDGLLVGKPELKPGIVVKVTVNPEDPSDRFNGMYRLFSCSHRYRHSGGGEGGDGGYTTLIRFRRDAHGSSGEGGGGQSA